MIYIKTFELCRLHWRFFFDLRHISSSSSNKRQKTSLFPAYNNKNSTLAPFQPATAIKKLLTQYCSSNIKIYYITCDTTPWKEPCFCVMSTYLWYLRYTSLILVFHTFMYLCKLCRLKWMSSTDDHYSSRYLPVLGGKLYCSFKKCLFS